MSTIITISREYGAGGTSIGRRVAKELGIEIYDRDIIRNTVLQTGLDAGVVARMACRRLGRPGIFRMAVHAEGMPGILHFFLA